MFVNCSSVKLIRKKRKKKKSSSTNCCDPSMLKHFSSQIICGLQSQLFCGSLWNWITASKHAPRCWNISHAGEVIFQVFGGFDIFPDLKQTTTSYNGILHSTNKELETDLLSYSLIQFNINTFFSCYQTKYKAIGKLCKIKITNEEVYPDSKWLITSKTSHAKETISKFQ